MRKLWTLSLSAADLRHNLYFLGNNLDNMKKLMAKTPDTTDMVRQLGGCCSENETRNLTARDRLDQASERTEI